MYFPKYNYNDMHIMDIYVWTTKEVDMLYKFPLTFSFDFLWFEYQGV